MGASKLYTKSDTWRKRPQNKPRSVCQALAYKGVQIRAHIRHDGKLIFLGTFESAEAAAIAYDEAAIRMHGEFAVTNKSLGLLDHEGLR